MNFIYFALIGIAAGWLAGQLMKGRSFGVAGNLLLGVVGAIVGGLLFRLLDLRAGGLVGELVVATAGAALVLYLAPYLRRLK